MIFIRLPFKKITVGVQEKVKKLDEALHMYRQQCTKIYSIKRKYRVHLRIAKTYRNYATHKELTILLLEIRFERSSLSVKRHQKQPHVLNCEAACNKNDCINFCPEVIICWKKNMYTCSCCGSANFNSLHVNSH